MEDKEIYTGVYEMLSYTDVLRHIADKHGPEGIAIVKDGNQMPVLWHETKHLNGDTNHLHASSHKETLERMKDLVELVSSDESEMEKLKEMIVEGRAGEEFSKVNNYLDELKDK